MNGTTSLVTAAAQNQQICKGLSWVSLTGQLWPCTSAHNSLGVEAVTGIQSEVLKLLLHQNIGTMSHLHLTLLQLLCTKQSCMRQPMCTMGGVTCSAKVQLSLNEDLEMTFPDPTGHKASFTKFLEDDTGASGLHMQAALPATGASSCLLER